MNTAEAAACIRYIIRHLDLNGWHSWAPGEWDPEVSKTDEKKLRQLGYIKKRRGQYIINEETCKYIL